MSSIDEIKARIDIVELVSESVQLRRSGKNYTGFCPFHPNSRTPAFVVFSDSGTWRCFGQCNEGGDIFKFIMKKEGLDFSEALRRLAERAGVQLKPPTPESQAAEEEHQALRTLLEEAVVFYRHQLVNTTAGAPALDYLHQRRGLRDATLEAFEIGYAPNSWDAIRQHFLSRNRGEDELLACGLLTQGDTSNVYDRFRNRIMFPIRDERGRMSGFGARVMNPDDVPKFINTPQTPIFDKGRLLFGLNRARKAIREREQAVIVEGYLDVIALHQAGYVNAVSPMGTALTEHQLTLLKRYAQRIVLALDSDAAGNHATLRGLHVARQALDREVDLIHDSRGLLRQESRLKADLRVTVLPPGMDPDEVVGRNPQEWEQILATARPVVIHVMETLAKGRDIDDPKVKNEIAAQVLPLIAEIPNPVERQDYTQRLARLLRVSERAIPEPSPGGGQVHRPSRHLVQKPTPKPALKNQPLVQSTTYLLEAYCLGVLLRRPELVYRIDRALQEDGLSRLSAEDFQHGDHQAIFRVLLDSIDQDQSEPLHFTLNNLSLPMMDLADDLLARTDNLDTTEDKVFEDLRRRLLDLRRQNLRQNLDYLNYLMTQAQSEGDPLAIGFQQAAKQISLLMGKVDKALQSDVKRAVVTRSGGSN